MTRQKKEIIKRIVALDREAAVDRALAFGCVPDGGLDPYYDEIDRLEDELARLQHFKSREDMIPSRVTLFE